MGACISNGVAYIEQPDGTEDALNADRVEQRANNKNIGKYMEYQQKIEMKIKKLLLLGAGSSGKSTLFKQLKDIYKDGYEGDRIESRNKIRQNCVDAMLKLCKQSQILYEWDPELHSDCLIDLDANKEIVSLIQVLLEFTGNVLKGSNKLELLTEDSAESLREALTTLWAVPQIKTTWNKRHYYAFIENMDYFYGKIDEIFSVDYEASLEDTLKCRIRTTGCIEEKFIINNIQFSIFDAGGQRNERKKWIKLFDGVTAIIFVAALNHYATILFEDESRNSMIESLQLFDEICNQKWFRKTEIILFLNKNDLFQHRLREGISLSVAFGDKWDGPDYEEQADEEKDAEHFELCHKAASSFIRREYESLNRNPYKKIFVHITTATNKNNVQSVFWDVQNIIVSGNMKTSGLV